VATDLGHGVYGDVAATQLIGEHVTSLSTPALEAI